jgi:hypothetical protein
MAINQNHTAEELNGIKCAIVEKNVAKDRLAFLEKILIRNGLQVVAAPSPPPKTTPPSIQPSVSDEIAAADLPPAKETFTLGVTDLTFNPVNAIFGRLLKTIDGHTVTLSYWQQKENESRDEIPYYEA